MVRTRTFEIVHWQHREPPLVGLKPNADGKYIVELTGDEILHLLDTHNIKLQRRSEGPMRLWVAGPTENFGQR